MSKGLYLLVMMVCSLRGLLEANDREHLAAVGDIFNMVDNITSRISMSSFFALHHTTFDMITKQYSLYCSACRSLVWKTGLQKLRL